MSFSASASPAAISLYDARPFFEKALQFGVQSGILDLHKIEAIRADAPKGMVQIARYFGSKFLRPDLEKAKERIVNLVSLYLENISGGDLRLAAESLRNQSFLSHSKGGSEMLKNLFALPDNTLFEAESGSDTSNESTFTETEWLAEWSLKSFADYRAELVKRIPLQLKKDAAIWLTRQLGMRPNQFKYLHPHPVEIDAIIRTALLAFSTKNTKFPDWAEFSKMMVALRKRNRSAKARAVLRAAKIGNTSTKPWTFSIVIPINLPENLMPVVVDVQQSVAADLPKIFTSPLSVRKLFDHESQDDHPPLLGRYCWLEDMETQVKDYEISVSETWDKISSEKRDESSVLTLLVCVAVGAAPKTLLTERSAKALIRKIQKADVTRGFDPDLARCYIKAHAPAQYQEGYLHLWDAFVEEAQPTLQSDSAFAMNDALALLRRECHVTAA